MQLRGEGARDVLLGGEAEPHDGVPEALLLAVDDLGLSQCTLQLRTVDDALVEQQLADAATGTRRVRSRGYVCHRRRVG